VIYLWLDRLHRRRAGRVPRERRQWFRAAVRAFRT
jgi:hypothetical protein